MKTPRKPLVSFVGYDPKAKAEADANDAAARAAIAANDDPAALLPHADIAATLEAGAKVMAAAEATLDTHAEFDAQKAILDREAEDARAKAEALKRAAAHRPKR